MSAFLPYVQLKTALEARRRREGLSDADFHMLQKWTEEGCCTVSGVIPEKQIDAMVADMEDIRTSAQPIERFGDS